MATGTEGPDVLTNDQSLSEETINALGGDDIIDVTNPHPANWSPTTMVTRVTIDGGAGFDTLRLSGRRVNLSPNSAFVNDGTSGASVFIFEWGSFISWSQIERLVVSGTAYSGRNQDGSYSATSWTTGDTIDKLDVATIGGAPITVSSGGGNDEIAIWGNVGAGSGANGGPGDDLIDFRGTTAVSRVVFAPPDFGRIYYLFANGEDGNDTLIGSAGEDRLNGGAGNDQLRSGLGDDTLRGGAGDDLLYFGAAFGGTDVADGGDGRDAIVLQGNVAIVFGETQLTGLESISLQSGANTQFGDTADNFYAYSVTTANGNVAAGQQMIVNGQSLRAGEDLTFDGSAESDGQFLVFGGHGVDTLKGGSGNDLFVFDADRWGANDKVDGGAGRDAVVITAGNGLTHIDFGATSLVGIESLSVANRYASDPTATPSYEFVLDNGNVAPGGTLIVNASSLAAGQVMKLEGRGVHDGNLILFGGAGHDTLTAGDGADLLVGGARADGLTGGAGADTFRYDAAGDSIAGAEDLIGDFQTGLDKIDLSRIDADSATAGDQAFHWIGSNAFSGGGAPSAGELRVYENGGYGWIEGDTDGDGLADLVIVLQVGTAPLVQEDFLL
jgi:Ca2+-binding RTX toxin-like protein